MQTIFHTFKTWFSPYDFFPINPKCVFDHNEHIFIRLKHVSALIYFTVTDTVTEGKGIYNYRYRYRFKIPLPHRSVVDSTL